MQGHRWIFSNEISSRLTDYEPGSWVEVFSSKGVSLGSGYVNPKSLISVRLVCRPGEKPSRDFFHDLIKKAATIRGDLFYPGSSCYRALFGESDGIPGLIVDRYNDLVVYQVTTLGISIMESLFQEILLDIFKPEALAFRHDTRIRLLEGLPLDKGVAFGKIPEEHEVDIDGIFYKVDVLRGQKTGLFLDQRDNRKALGRWASGKRVLDLFCYNGAWSLSAASAGAMEAMGVDQSSEAISQANENAARNRLDGVCRFVESDVLSYLKEVKKGYFDIIVLDPPAFAKTKNALPEARKGYADINRRALLALKPGGLLVSSSCSYHLTEELFREALLQAALSSGRQLRLLETRGQAADHPALLAMPETRYLKCYFLEVM